MQKYSQKNKNALYGVLRAYKQLVKRGMKVKLDKVKNIDVVRTKDADKCMAGLALIRDMREA